MNRLKYEIWNICDHCAGFHHKTFKFFAYLNHLLGCDYWYKSKDYQQG